MLYYQTQLYIIHQFVAIFQILQNRAFTKQLKNIIVFKAVSWHVFEKQNNIQKFLKNCFHALKMTSYLQFLRIKTA